METTTKTKESKSAEGKKENNNQQELNKYSLANKRRWADISYKKRVGKKISSANKGQKPWNLGKNHSEETKQKISNSFYHKNHKGQNKKENNPNWSGDDIKYNGLHLWISKNFERGLTCNICKKNKVLEWSNKNHKYSRKRKDWQLVCRSCHRRYDNDNN